MAPYIDSDSPALANGIHLDAKSSRTRETHTPRPRTQENGQMDVHVDDLLCIGFGPASLAIAIALREKFQDSKRHHPQVSFLERQPEFAWHAGMLLPGSKMQISFIKDLATLRNPRSEFTFLNYLHRHDRLVQFSNLGTFLPSRVEFEDYMRWCAGHFQDGICYGHEVLGIYPGEDHDSDRHGSKTAYFSVQSREVDTGTVHVRHARHVVVAIGGTPRVPDPFPPHHPKVVHSSAYAKRVHAALPNKDDNYRIAVVGSGQSAAEIFNDLHSRFPNSQTRLIIKDTALRPSDDSPFVNEIFNPDRVSTFYGLPEEYRSRSLAADKGTNYGVVRIELLDHIYEELYQQRVKSPDEKGWQHRILTSSTISNVSPISEKGPLALTINDSNTGSQKEILEVDAVFVATGYTRDAHEEIMRPLQRLTKPSASTDRKWQVRRDYKVDLDDSKVAEGAGVWLQGCNQDTHGLADTLLSVLAVRGGELVDSIFVAEDP